MSEKNTSAPEQTAVEPTANNTESSAKDMAQNVVEQTPEDFLQVSKTDHSELISKSEKGTAAAGYLPFICVLPLVLHKESAFCKHHAKQSIAVAGLFSVLFLIMPLMGLSWLFFFSYLLVAGYGAFTAFTGKEAKMPFFSEIAKKINL